MFSFETDDDSLMKKVSEGDMKAFEVLFDRYSGKVLNYSKRLSGGNGGVAEDISQTVWVKVAQSAKTYQSRGQFKSWLFAITRNTAFDEIRTTTEFENLDAPGLENQETDSSSVKEAREFFESKIIKEAEVATLKQAIDSLPESQRTILMMWIVEELSYEDLAKNLNSSVSAVKSSLFRAKENLDKKLRGHDE